MANNQEIINVFNKIKKHLFIILKNIDKLLASIVFICTFSGAWFLFSYAKAHGVKYLDLIQTNLLITFGAFSFIIIFYIIVMFLGAFYFSPVVARSFYYRILLKEKTGSRKKTLTLYIIYFALSGIIASVSVHIGFYGIPLLLSLVICVHFYVMQKPISRKSASKTCELFIFTILLFIITYAVFGFLSVTLHFKVEKISSFYGILQSVFIFIIVVSLSLIGLADRHHRKRDLKKRVMFHSFFSLIAIFYIATAFSIGVSEKITNMIGLGYEERCYYKKDLLKYSIPASFPQTVKDNSKYKLYVVADINGKMYISRNENYGAAFQFITKDLNQVYCDK